VSSGTDEDRLLTDVRQRRAELRRAMGAVELALAAPSGAGGADWSAKVRAALLDLLTGVREHIVLTEGADGLYRELTQTSPRLLGPVDQLTCEHAQIMRRIEELLIWVDVTNDLPDVNEVRRIGTELLSALIRHRQRGADLIFEAYDLDIGGET
jgi:hypothetical protein